MSRVHTAVIDVVGGTTITGSTPPTVQEAIDALKTQADVLVQRIFSKAPFSCRPFREGDQDMEEVRNVPISAQIASVTLLLRELAKTL